MIWGSRNATRTRSVGLRGGVKVLDDDTREVDDDRIESIYQISAAEFRGSTG